MILGLYEAHLPVKDLEVSIPFYTSLGLKLAWCDQDTAFFWIEEGLSWLGLWEGEEYQVPYHPALRHIAFRVSYEELNRSVEWLQSVHIQPVPFGSRKTVDPFIRPYQENASVYFNDPDGNSLELMCHIDVPDQLKKIKDKLSFEQWENCNGKKELNEIQGEKAEAAE